MKRRALQLGQKNGERYTLLRYGIAQNAIVCTWDVRKFKHSETRLSYRFISDRDVRKFFSSRFQIVQCFFFFIF